jgi:16S rRNA processing protein RimM
LSSPLEIPTDGWLAVGCVRRPHGVHGEVLVEVVTDFPERMVAGLEVGMGDAGPARLLRVASVRLHKGGWLLSFEGVSNRDDVEGWRGLFLYLPPQDRASLPATYYFEHELTGLTCTGADGERLGEATGLWDAGGRPLLLVQTGSGEVMVPFRSPIVVRVDLAAGVIVLDPPRGLFDDDAV